MYLKDESSKGDVYRMERETTTVKDRSGEEKDAPAKADGKSRTKQTTKTIVYFKHGLGNLIMMTPAIRALASIDPSGKVDICMSSKWQDDRRPAFDDFFKRWNIVEEVINYPEMNFTKDYTRWFYTGHAEHCEAMDIFSKKCKLKVEAPDWRENGHLHEVFFYMNIVYKMGYKGSVPDQFVPLACSPKLNSNKLRIGLCNGTYSYKMKTAKQWPYFNELVDLLRHLYDVRIIKLGYGDELKDVKGDVDYVGKLSFTESAKVVSQLDLLITTDTALMHVGDALRIPMVAIFGGTLISKNGAISKKAKHVTLGLACQPCQRTHSFYNCDHYDCINKLSLGDVMPVVRGILNDTCKL